MNTEMRELTIDELDAVGGGTELDVVVAEIVKVATKLEAAVELRSPTSPSPTPTL